MIKQILIDKNIVTEDDYFDNQVTMFTSDSYLSEIEKAQNHQKKSLLYFIEQLNHSQNQELTSKLKLIVDSTKDI